MMKTIYFILILFCAYIPALAQQPGETTGGFNKDTVFVFKSPRPLLTYEEKNATINDGTGIKLVLNESGFGFGMFHQRQINDDFAWFIETYFSSARNADEFEYYNFEEQEYRVPNKVNRVYKMPLMVGIQYFVFKDFLHKNFRPMVNAGFGPTFIASTPYNKGWFEAWDSAKYFGRFGGFVGIGANFGSNMGMSSINVRYYYVPAGESEIESLRDFPIDNFGGLTISLNIGF
jgi:hypothetical protein